MRHHYRTLFLLTATILILGIAGCGRKGDLVLPDSSGAAGTPTQEAVKVK